jgi:hypothetical protein
MGVLLLNPSETLPRSFAPVAAHAGRFALRRRTWPARTDVHR